MSPCLPPLPLEIRTYDRSSDPDSGLNLVDDVFADDSAFFVADVCPVVTLAKLAAVTNIVKSTYRAHCLIVNFKAGKTEALVDLRNHGIIAVRTRLFHTLKAMLPFCPP